MNATEPHSRASSRSFPFLFLASAGIPVFCGAIVALLAAVRSDYVIPAALFAFFLTAAGGIIGLIGLAFGERPRWLLFVALATSALLLCGLTFIDLH